MVTKLGKICRKLRIDRGEILYDMAIKLGVSSSFLSKVETGKKKPPIEWEEKIINEYGLIGQEYDLFKEAFFEAINYDSINISDMKPSDKELMLLFARRFDSLDKQAIKKYLESNGEE